ncbi:UDP binding domain-containing protein, partial [Agromyces humi]|uniref:UDP binding domain-containing protein n=1 Tax=Agromyces humi TaxID=1766800 RepID=UPI001F1790D9
LHPQLEFSDDLSAVLEGADLVVLVTEWNEYRHMDPVWAGDLVGVRSVIDGRNCLDAKAWRDAGWTYKGLGRP